ncbi:RE1-silencing transcription factor isoform X4 [Phthorimaea operculella]|nr:RE1-silencing transcription factor isoform X4 [Phthorimaea operculella]
MVHSDLPQLKCHHCPASFLSTEEMDAHQVRHVNVLERKYTCTDCQKNPLLDMVHSDLPQLKCHHCPASFLSTEEMDAHQVRHVNVLERKYTCTDCQKNPLLDMVHSDLPQLKCHHCPASFLSTEEMDAHQVRHVNVLERKYTCTDCQKNPLLDMVHSDLPQLKCHHCPASFLSTEEMDAHQSTVATIVHCWTWSSDLPQLKCHHCPASFLSTEEMDAHQVRHVNVLERKYTCTDCQKNPLLDMVHSDLPQLKCHHCPASFLSTEEMDAHQVRHVNVLERKYTCTDCQKNPLLDMVHSDLPQLKCHHCPASFLSTEEMDAHQVRHVNVLERKYTCTDCQKNPLLDMVHSDLPQLKCHHCPASFLSTEEMDAHQVRHVNVLERKYTCTDCQKNPLLDMVHSDLPQLKCHHCPASFLSTEEMDAHQVRHVNVLERKYTCTDCQKKFIDSTSLLRHIDSVHEVKPVLACEYCPEKFTSISKLTRHVRTHAGDRPYPCRYCEKSFTKSHHYTRHLRVKHGDQPGSQDELMYHSAIHATQNLTCPLCQEKFEDVDAVTLHIKSHVTGMEFMCDFCELVFTSKEKLDQHIDNVHEDELHNMDEMDQDDGSMDMEDNEEEDDDDNPINVKQEGDHMVVEIKKPSEFLLSRPTDRNLEDTFNNTNSEAQVAPKPPPSENSVVSKPAQVLRKTEEIKRKSTQETPPPEKKEKPKVESSTGGASDKSLRLLEKELQELQRTNKREETNRTPAKSLETVRGRGRPPIHTSTPKLSRSEEKKNTTKSTPTERKVPERRAVKENKKPEETKSNNNSIKNNSINNKSASEEPVRRSSRPSKVKDYAKMVNVSINNESASEEPRPSKVKDYAKMVNVSPKPDEASDDDSEDDDEEYVEQETKPEPKPKAKRVAQKPAKAATKSPAPATPATPAPKKRGRPRKDATPAEVPAKVKKADKIEKSVNDEKEDIPAEKMETEETSSSQTHTEQESDISQEQINTSQCTPTKTENEEQNANSPLVQTPTGQTLKKVPIKNLPPGVKPLPLPAGGRPLPNQPVTEMQIGKKMVKVQKIVMTKAEVEAMAKKGLVEMKDGTMVLKAGVKLPSDASALKSLVGEDEKKALKESPSKASPAPTPTRCEFDDA